MEAFSEVLKLIPLQNGLMGTALVLAVLMRFLRGSLHNVGGGWTYAAAVGLGILGAVLSMAAEEPWRTTATNALSLTAIVLVGQKVLEKLAEKVWWLPTDNEWAGKGKP